VKIWTSPDPARTVAVVSFLPGSLDIRKLSAALLSEGPHRLRDERRPGSSGIRLSPHFYNTHADIDRTVAAIKRLRGDGSCREGRVGPVGLVGRVGGNWT